MVTRSIVGRFLIMAVLLVSLGVIAQAALIISKGAGKTVAKGDAASGPVAVAALAPTAAATPAIAPVPASAPSTPQVSAGPQAASGAQQGLTDAAPVRVVYPGPLGDAPVQVRKITDPAPASPLAAPASAQPATPASSAPAPAAVAVPATPAPASPATVAAAPAQPAPVVVASADADTQPAAADPAASPKGGVNLNSASVEALNHIGGGHIGQSIVQHRPYHSVEDLVKKRVVRRSVYEQIKDQVAAE